MFEIFVSSFQRLYNFRVHQRCGPKSPKHAKSEEELSVNKNVYLLEIFQKIKFLLGKSNEFGDQRRISTTSSLRTRFAGLGF